MSGESSVPKPELSKRFREQSCKFGTVVLALWPIKPAIHLSQKIGCTERHANLLIAGKRKPNARAALVVYAEIIG